MHDSLILASSSEIRAALLRNAGVPFTIHPADIDESNLKTEMQSRNVDRTTIASALATAKARAVSSAFPERLVLGCDQLLVFDGRVLSKPTSTSDAIAQLHRMSGNWHELITSAVVIEGEGIAWSAVGRVNLRMHRLSDDYICDYVDRNWSSIRFSVGGYKIEEEGVRLFERIEGDHFHILGLPLLELLEYLTHKGVIAR